MSHFAKVVNGKVVQVIVAESDFFASFIDSSPGQWIQTSFNTRAGVHYGFDGKPDGGIALRANYAGIDYSYDQANDVFYAPQPYPSWTINAPTWIWQPPVPYPNDGNTYNWDEQTKSWVLVPSLGA
jgi:hypothetical protein